MATSNQHSGATSKQKFWRQHIQNCQHSQLNQKEYCSQNGLALSTFLYWKKKLDTRETKTPRFYPLTVQSLPSPASKKANSGLSLEMCNSKFRIELAEDFSAGCLKKLILTLEQL